MLGITITTIVMSTVKSNWQLFAIIGTINKIIIIAIITMTVKNMNLLI